MARQFSTGTKFGSEKGKIQKSARIPPQTPPAGGKKAEAGQFHSPRKIVCPAESKLVFRVLLKKSSNINQKTPLDKNILNENKDFIGGFDFNVFLLSALAVSVFIFGKNNFFQKKTANIINKEETAPVPVVVKNQSQSERPITIQKENISLIFAGDLMFDRYIRQVAEKKGSDFIFEEIGEYLKSVDLVVANLEGPISNQLSKSVNSEFGSKENYIFTFNPSLAATLYRQNIKLVNLGNNHILNFGEEGLNQTVKYLNENKIKYFGDVDTGCSCTWSNSMDIGGIKIGFVNYNQFIEESLKNALADLEKLKSITDLLIVYTHWGKEYETISNKNQQAVAHQLIENGADLIIGSHPHVIQEKEIYKDKVIYYSLGNFIFDQYFQKETAKGLLLRITINSQGKILEIKEKEIILKNNGQTAFPK